MSALDKGYVDSLSVGGERGGGGICACSLACGRINREEHAPVVMVTQTSGCSENGEFQPPDKVEARVQRNRTGRTERGTRGKIGRRGLIMRDRGRHKKPDKDSVCSGGREGERG